MAPDIHLMAASGWKVVCAAYCKGCVITFTTPPMASLPYSADPPLSRISILYNQAGSSVLRYWLGPERKVALLSRIPSTSNSVCWPVSPRRKREPPPWLVFCKNTPGASNSISGTLRAMRFFKYFASNTVVTTGRLYASWRCLCAVTTTSFFQTTGSPWSLVSIGESTCAPPEANCSQKSPKYKCLFHKQLITICFSFCIHIHTPLLNAPLFRSFGFTSANPAHRLSPYSPPLFSLIKSSTLSNLGDSRSDFQSNCASKGVSSFCGSSTRGSTGRALYGVKSG